MIGMGEETWEREEMENRCRREREREEERNSDGEERGRKLKRVKRK